MNINIAKEIKLVIRNLACKEQIQLRILTCLGTYKLSFYL